MKTIGLSELGNIDFLLKDVVMMEQCWREGGEFNTLKTPKKSQSFCYLNGCCIDYVFPDGTKLSAKEGDCVYIPKGARYKLTVRNKTKQIGLKLLNFNLVYKTESFNLWDKLCVVYTGGAEMQKLFGNFITEFV